MWLLATVLHRWSSRTFFSETVLSGFKILCLVLALGFRKLPELTDLFTQLCSESYFPSPPFLKIGRLIMPKERLS